MSGLFPPLESRPGPILQVRNLAVGYSGETIASGLNLDLGAGQTVALIGGNGSGKTTFLKTIAGLLPPLSGQVTLCGLPPQKAGKHLGWLGQFHPANPLLSLRVGDIVRMAHFPERGLLQRLTKEDEALVKEALEFVGMAAWFKKPVGELSGGQRQKVFLAYVLVRRAPLILLDEPLQNLDDQGSLLVAEASRLWKASGRAIAVATHDSDEAHRCDQSLTFSH